MRLNQKVQAAFVAVMVLTGSPVAKSTLAIDVSELPKLRKQIGWSRDYLARCDSGRPIREIYELIEKKQWREVTTQSEAWLTQCPIDIRVHLFAGIGYSELGSTERAKYHSDAWKTLMDDIFASGKGTKDSPVEVISVSEEYDVLFMLRATLKHQEIVQGEVAMDEIEFETQSGKIGKLYFNPAAHFQRLIENRGFDVSQ